MKLFFKNKRPRQFSLPKRYHDEKAERLHNLKAQHGLLDEHEIDKKQHRANPSFKAKWKANQKGVGRAPSTNLRLVIIITILLFVSYFLYTNHFSRLLNNYLNS